MPACVPKSNQRKLQLLFTYLSCPFHMELKAVYTPPTLEVKQLRSLVGRSLPCPALQPWWQSVKIVI